MATSDIFTLPSLPLSPNGPFPLPSSLDPTSDSDGDSLKGLEIDDNYLVEAPIFKPDRRFWFIMSSLMCSAFLSAFDLSCVALALPAIADDLNGADCIIWCGAAVHALTSTALIPWTGSLASIVGRRPALLCSIAFFATGSAICGAAKTMPAMIAGRAVAGCGGGGIICLTLIVVTDLIPLAQRGPYCGLVGSVWALATTIGPPLSGALTSAGQWRWIFLLNLPVSVVAFILVFLFLDVKEPQTTWRQKLQLMDWYNIIFVGSTSAIVLALTWGGTVGHPWRSPVVLVPLILGVLGLIFFVWVEQFAPNPTIPLSILRHPTSLIGCIETFLQAIVLITMVYFVGPIYFQAAKGESPVLAGVYSLPLSFTVAPCAILCGTLVARAGTYKTINIVAWCWAVLGLGLLTLLEPHSPTAMWVVFPMTLGVGLGLLQTGVTFPVLAALDPKDQPQAIAFQTFVRAFGDVIGITVGGVILENYFQSRLPPKLVAQFPPGQQFAFAAIPFIPNLQEPLKTDVQLVYAHSLHAIAYFLIGVSVVGGLVCFGMKNIVLSRETDAQWGLEEVVDGHAWEMKDSINHAVGKKQSESDTTMKEIV